MSDTAAESQGPGAWPWIAGLLVLALLLWGLTRLLDGGAPVVPDPAHAAAQR